MRNYLIVFFAALSLFFSCSEKEQPEEVKYVKFSIEVQLDTTGIGTKTSMSDDGTVGKVKWSSTDYLIMYNSSDGCYTSNFAKDISDDGTKAYFIFKVSENLAAGLASDKLYLYYGNTNILSHSYRDYTHSFSVSLPANQTHAGTNCFQEFENIAFGYCPAGTFKYEAGTDTYVGTAGCVMRNAFGILKVPIALNNASDVSKVRYVRLTDGTSGQYLAGTFNVTISTSGDLVGAPSLSHKAGTGGESLTIEKYIPKTAQLSSTNPYVYFLVPPGTLFGTNGFTLAVYTDDGYYGSKTVKPKSESNIAIERSKITQLNLSSFTPKPFPPTEPLTANSYIFDATAGVASFPAHYQGNGYQGNGGTDSTAVAARSHKIDYNSSYYAEVIWQTKCNGETILAAEVIDSPVYYNTDSGPCISFHKSGVKGNALIALRNPGKKVSVKQLDGTVKNDIDQILWSWHVWITDNPDEVIVSGRGHSFIIMDRNLGALSDVPEGLSQFHGLAYQYGRKDPFMGSRYTITKGEKYEAYASIYPPTAIWTVSAIADNFELSVVSPNVRYMGTNAWCNSNVNVGWGDPAGSLTTVHPKTLVDPCPVGWKVISESNVIAVLGYKDTTGRKLNKPEGEVVSSGEGFAFKLANGGAHVYFPAAGSSVSHETIDAVGTSAQLWGATYNASSSSTSGVHFDAMRMAFTLSAGNYELITDGLAMKTTMPVRCQKWDEPGSGNQSGNVTAYIADNTDVDAQ